MAHTTAGQHVQPILQRAMSSGSGKPAVEFRFNPDNETVDVNGQRVRLTQKEYQVLELLWVHKGETLTKQMILNHLYGGTYEPGQKVIDVFICRIRKKLRATIGDDYIETVWGRGYMLPDPNP
jgi:two-component system, cell cycle response regulator CtrA